MRLFEVLGGWVATVPELDVKLRLGTHCYHHAWHAELWHKRLPELREMNPERLTLPPNDELVAFVDALTEPEGPDLTIEKLVGAYRVLIPAKIAAYTYHLNNTSTITDAPTMRSLKFCLAGRVRRLAGRRDDAAVPHRHATRSCSGRSTTRPSCRSCCWPPAASPAPAPSETRTPAKRRTTHEEVLPRRGPGPRRSLRPGADDGALQRSADRAGRRAAARPSATDRVASPPIVPTRPTPPAG